jgi:hypothetical protein
LGLWCVLIELHELGKIELRFLKDLDLSHHDVVLKWEDLVALLLNSFADIVLDSIKYKLLLIFRIYKLRKQKLNTYKTLTRSLRDDF